MQSVGRARAHRRVGVREHRRVRHRRRVGRQPARVAGRAEAEPGPPERGPRPSTRRSPNWSRSRLPESMVDADLNQRVQGTVEQFQAQGIDLGQWLAATGQGPDEFIESMRGASVEAVKVDLALRAVADAESIEVEPRRLRARVRPHGDAVRPEGQGDPQGLRGQRSRAGTRCPDPQVEGDGLAAAPRRVRRRRGRPDRP